MSREAPARQADNATTGHNASRKTCVFGITANSATVKYPSMGGRTWDTDNIMSMENVGEMNDASQ